MNLNLQPYKGTRDIYPEDMRLRQYIFDTWRKVVESFGYEKYDVPILEPLELYAAKTGEEIVNEQTYVFNDRGDRRVTIRPEMTPSVARMVAARRQEIPLPARLYSIANFMRYERPQKGREREFWQLNVDIFGVADTRADIEVVSIADQILREFGAGPEMYTILLNDRRLTDYIMRDYLGLTEAQASAMIKLFDRRKKISEADFDAQVAEIAPENTSETLAKIQKITEVNNLDDVPTGAPINDLQKVLATLTKKGINAKYDPTLMRGFDYYTGIVFEVFDQNPDNNRSMFGGGRYDGLVGLFGVEDLPVVGFAPGETTMIEFLRAWNLLPKLSPTTTIVIAPIGEVDVTAVADQLRAAGINVAIDFTDRKLDKVIKSAVKSGAPYLMIIGEDEITSNQFKLKNLSEETEKTLSIDQIVDIVARS
ncbi:histidine--tRNA ligase [Candidatus Saccharibacteria bacterium]|nr:histidine--tRNA ligase [Candidatus Saccharibacteria bacterium]